VTNSSRVTDGVSTTTYTYSTSLSDKTANALASLAESFSSSNSSTEGSFGGSTFPVPEGAVKFSVDLNTTSGSFTKGLTLTFDLSISGFLTDSGEGSVILGGSADNITTYYLVTSSLVPGGTQSAVQVDVFDIAHIDGASFQPVTSSILVGASSNGSGLFTLVLNFPPFAHSLHYDPVINLVSLHSSSGSGGGDGGGDDIGLIVGLTVGLGVPSILLVLAGIVAVVVLALYLKRQPSNTGILSDDNL